MEENDFTLSPSFHQSFVHGKSYMNLCSSAYSTKLFEFINPNSQFIFNFAT